MIRIEVEQGIDELGEPEEFTFDLFPIVNGTETLHLDENGLPKIGTCIQPGMIIIGKIGKTKKYDQDFQPNALEVHGWPAGQVSAKYGHMWKNTSVHATATTCGVVTKAYLEQAASEIRAVVEIEPV